MIKPFRAFFIVICSMAIMAGDGVAVSQTITGGNLKGGVSFFMGFPRNEFDSNVESNGYGVNLHFGYTIPQTPVTFGLDGGFLIYGHETRREPFSLTIPDVTVKVETSNNIVPLHLFMRVSPPLGPFVPYLEGLVGLNYLYTETSIKDEDDPGNDEIASSKNFEDTAFSYGGGVGMLLRVYGAKHQARRLDSSDKDAKLHSVYINLTLRYMKGGEAEYLKKGGREIVDGRVIFDVLQSNTDMLMAKIGIELAF